MRVLAIIPTYNEVENIPPLLKEIFFQVDQAYAVGSLSSPSTSQKNTLDFHCLVVDDNSPDGTGTAVKEIQANASYGARTHLLSRPGKQGLGKAYLAGFAWGIERGFDCLIEMDADFSHRPIDLVKIIETLMRGADFAVGSRYVEGGGTENWGLGRKIISRGGSLYSRMILGYPLNDWTGGFNGWSVKVLNEIGLDKVKSEGYSFQIELKYRALRNGFHGEEVPIWFEDRRVGQSKMSARIVFEAFGRVWGMRFG